jgi:TPR repeat protein
MHISILEQEPEKRKQKTPRRRLRAAIATLLLIVAPLQSFAADRLSAGAAAAAAHDYVRASQIFLDLAVQGDSRAQAYLGFMYAHGQGVAQNYVVAAAWYRCAGDQGVANAQYELGLMYDIGQGVPQDYVLAYTWMNLAVAGAGREREHWTLIRNALASKLSLAERLKAQTLATAGPPPQPCLPIIAGYGGVH